MNNKIRVYLQYPWKFPDSPYYNYLIENSPKEIEFLNTRKQKGVITKKSSFLLSNLAKKLIRQLVNILNPGMLNAHLSPNGDYDLIHCAHCISKNKGKPWVADIEFPSQIWVSLRIPKNLEKALKILEDKNCKKLIFWTEYMRKDFLKLFPSMGFKSEVIYPPVPIIKIKKKKHEGINIFFAARYFLPKGGLHALEAMDILTKRYSNVQGIIVSEVPEEIKKRYSKNKKLSFYPLLPQKELFNKVYSIGDIFLYPGYSDSFGFAIPEVMGMGIPVVSVDLNSRRELITNAKNGFLVENDLSQIDLRKNSISVRAEKSQDLIKGLISKTSLLVEDESLLKKFSQEARKEVSSGKFSVKETSKKLKKVYYDALK